MWLKLVQSESLLVARPVQLWDSSAGRLKLEVGIVGENRSKHKGKDKESDDMDMVTCLRPRLQVSLKIMFEIYKFFA